MINFITSEFSFEILFLLFSVGAIGSLFLNKNDKLANFWSSFFSISSSIWGLIISICAISFGQDLLFSVGHSVFSVFSVSFHVDKLSAFFIFIISLISLFCSIYGIGYVKHFYKKYNIGALGFFYNTFILGMLLVVSSSNGIFFLLAWELMSLASYFLVVYDRNDEENIKAGFLYFIMTHVGTAFIILALLLLYKFTGSFDFDIVKSNMGLVPLYIKNLVFIFSIIGFGTKAGIVPFHVWLPSAHPAAPSHVSALMSGVMIKTGIFMMIKIFLDILQPVPVWWGLTILVIGSVSSLLGVLYALTEHDLKRLLAYHSIENIGIILLGLGSALTFTSLGLPALALLGLIAALFHTLNHATFKSLLFLSAGSVISQTHTRNMEEFGGLIKYMPQTAFFFLIGSMAISALPPFNGFFSEWLTFQSLFQGIMSLDFYSKGIFIFAVGSLAFTGGLALACFVKAFGATFLARPRSEEVKHAKESSFSLLFGMGALALLSLVFGIFSGYLGSFFEKIAKSFTFAQNVFYPSFSTDSMLKVGNSFSSVSAPAIFIFFAIIFLIVIFVTKFLINRNQKVTINSTWDCGTDLTPRMEITATGFSRSIIVILKGILRPNIKKEIVYNDAGSKYLPKSRFVILSIKDIYQAYFYTPLHKITTFLSLQIKKIQNGNVNSYILYIFFALIVTLFLAI
ncbi:MAG: proton-conducting transporter membrane subunit [Candidatus Nomurabacteria bacterium]|nr:proton-conducting transporter membrane subunit [Candidatus Nomurabacteria bacterium]